MGLLQPEHLRHHVVSGGVQQDPARGQAHHHVTAHGRQADRDGIGTWKERQSSDQINSKIHSALQLNSVDMSTQHKQYHITGILPILRRTNNNRPLFPGSPVTHRISWCRASPPGCAGPESTRPECPRRGSPAGCWG